jgi:hypothetical protein
MQTLITNPKPKWRYLNWRIFFKKDLASVEKMKRMNARMYEEIRRDLCLCRSRCIVSILMTKEIFELTLDT